jgi:hypothetical protein
MYCAQRVCRYGFASRRGPSLPVFSLTDPQPVFEFIILPHRNRGGGSECDRGLGNGEERRKSEVANPPGKTTRIRAAEMRMT